MVTFMSKSYYMKDSVILTALKRVTLTEQCLQLTFHNKMRGAQPDNDFHIV